MFGAVCYQTSALEPIAVITSLIKTSTGFALEGEAPGRKNSPSGSNIVYQGLFSPWGLLTENSSATSLPPEMAAPSWMPQHKWGQNLLPLAVLSTAKPGWACQKKLKYKRSTQEG